MSTVMDVGIEGVEKVNITDVKNGDTINFETQLNERRLNMVYLGSVSWDIAATLGLDVQAKHRQYAIEAPPGGPADFKEYQYAIFRKPDGVRDIYGHTWIKEGTVELKETVTYQMHIPSATEAQLNSLRSFATAIGLEGFKIEPL